MPSTKEVGTSSGELNVGYSTNTASGDATAVKTLWTKAENGNAIYQPIVGALWSATPGTPSGSVEPPYATVGLSATTFWGGNGIGAYPADPAFAVTTGTIPTAGDFSHAKLNNNFFEDVAYAGAFGTEDWTDTWTEFRPLVKAY